MWHKVHTQSTRMQLLFNHNHHGNIKIIRIEIFLRIVFRNNLKATISERQNRWTNPTIFLNKIIVFSWFKSDKKQFFKVNNGLFYVEDHLQSGY